MSKIKPIILLAGLSDDLNTKFENILAAHDFRTTILDNSSDILEEIKKDYPELMIMDYNARGMDSLDIARSLKSNSKTKRIPILMLIDTEKPVQTERGIEAGCDDFLSYNVEEQELLTRIKTFIKINTYRLLLDEKEKFEEILNEISDGVIVLRPDWSIEKYNRNAVNLINLSSQSVGADFIEHCRENFSITKNLYDYIDSPEKELTFELIREDKTSVNPLFILVKCNFIKSPFGKNLRIILTLRNITESKIEEMLKQDFLSLISHKLRTPIVALTYSMRLVMKRHELNYSEEELDGFIANAYKKSKEVNELIEKLLVFSTVVNDKMFMKLEPIEIGQAIRENVEIYTSSRSKESSKTVEVEYLFPEESKEKVIFSGEYLKIILENLLDNGIKFNDKETARITIKIIKENENHFQVSITDNGPGIPHEEFENIFKKFYQVERYFTGAIEGIGIGLSLIKHILNTYDCQIWVESKIGKGSTFHFTLPAFKDAV
ncbi:MAG: hybrid sensor histidine kinase/response regulator [Candidatus Aureabacteria bacterium]|nr:hybrid sensor histidine kinase/response regulator [Candidatus Auribacterota bacterium]